MPSITATKSARIVGPAKSTQALARDASTGTVSPSPVATGGQTFAIQYFASSGRGGGTFRYTRCFFHFDCSGITSTVSDAKLQIFSSGTLNTADLILVDSDAMGGVGNNPVGDDFNNLDFSTTYSSEVTSWTTTGTRLNEITLNAAALSALRDNDNFTCALIDHDNDFQDTDTTGGSGSTAVGINFDINIKIDYNLAATGYTHLPLNIAAASVNQVNNVASADIHSIIDV